jgi:uncharacterized protein Yka (UPF0111/DUF47 family)
MNANESLSQLFNLLNELVNRSDLTVRIIDSSNELLETLKKTENCTSCKDNMGKYYNGIYESINKIKNYLVELEKGKKEEQEKEDITHKLSDELIKTDVQLSRNVLCGVCGGKKSINKLLSLSNELINRNDLTVRITGLSSELLETLKIVENCTSCKDKVGEYFEYFGKIYESIYQIENYLLELEKGEKEEQEKEDIIHKLSDELIGIYVNINRYGLCEDCGRNKPINKLFNLLNELINR